MATAIFLAILYLADCTKDNDPVVDTYGPWLLFGGLWAITYDILTVLM